MADRLRRARALREETFDRDGEEQGSGIKARASGVRAKALPIADEHDASEAPTLRPRAIVRPSVEELAPIHELLYRFDVGDHRGALATAEVLLDQTLVPSIVVPIALLESMELDTPSAILLSSIDGRATLEGVLERSGLPMLEALRALCDLIDQRIVSLTA